MWAAYIIVCSEGKIIVSVTILIAGGLVADSTPLFFVVRISLKTYVVAWQGETICTSQNSIPRERDERSSLGKMAQLLLQIMDVGLLFQSRTPMTFITKSRVYLAHRIGYCKKTVSYNRTLDKKKETGTRQAYVWCVWHVMFHLCIFNLFFGIGNFISWQRYWS